MSLENTPPEEDRPEENPPEDNQYDEFRDQFENEVPTEEGEEETPASNGNRTFLRFIGIIGSVIVLAVLALAGYFVISRSQLAARFQEQSAQLNAENTAVAVQATESSLQELQEMTQKAILPPTWTPTPQSGVAQATATPRTTNTTVPTSAGALGNDNRTATAAAFLTQTASGAAIGTPIAQATTALSATSRATTTATTRATATLRTSPTPLKTATALPQTGFADEVGLPGLLGLALGLVLVVFTVRRIRLSTSH